MPADADCTESDAIDAGILGGSSHDVTGNFDMGRCALDPDDTDRLYGNPDKTEGLVYSFTISSARTTNVTFNPTTSFEDTNPTGQYRVRVRSGSLDGTELGVQTGSGAMTIGPLDIGAGDHVLRRGDAFWDWRRWKGIQPGIHLSLHRAADTHAGPDPDAQAAAQP